MLAQRPRSRIRRDAQNNCVERGNRPAQPRQLPGIAHTVAMDVAAIVVVIVVTVLVVVSVLGLHVWVAIQDGREQRRREQRGG